MEAKAIHEGLSSAELESTSENAVCWILTE